MAGFALSSCPFARPGLYKPLDETIRAFFNQKRFGTFVMTRLCAVLIVSSSRIDNMEAFVSHLQPDITYMI